MRLLDMVTPDLSLLELAEALLNPENNHSSVGFSFASRIKSCISIR